MKLLIGLSVSIAAAALAAPGFAQTAAQDPESAQIVCDLTGDCGGDAAQAVPPGTPQPSATRRSRTGDTRGFTFQRQTTTTAAGAAPAARTETQVASRPAMPAVTKPAQVGASNLKVTFIPGSASLSDDSKTRLGKYASVLSSGSLAARRLRIEGYTDASGSSARNLDLSRRRAQAVADYLATGGVEKGRIDVVGYGDSRPLPGVPATAAENRRVVAVLL